MEAIKKTNCHLLIVELKSGDKSGLKLIRLLHQAHRGRLPMIAMSRDVKDGKRAFQAGAETFLNKPIQLQELVKAVSQYLAK
jgi:CheY-like chemotaxis protein